MSRTTIASGRHRYGRPGSIPVRMFVTVKQRNFFARLFGIGARPGRHALPLAPVIGLPIAESAAARPAAA